MSPSAWQHEAPLRRPFTRWPLLAALLLRPGLLATAATAPCRDEASCNQQLRDLVERLSIAQDRMKAKKVAIGTVEGFRDSLMRGQRMPLPSVQRQHLEKGSPLISEVVSDAKHRPVTNNISKHLRHMRSVATGEEVRLHGIMPVKKFGSQKSPGPSAMVATVDGRGQLSLHTMDGDLALPGLDLGHTAGRTITHLVPSSNPELNYVATADDGGEIRVHDIKVGPPAKKGAKDKEESAEKAGSRDLAQRQPPQVNTSLGASFLLPEGPGGETRRITALLPLDKGSRALYVVGDSKGGVAVFHRNGTLKGRIKVTDDPGGVRGLLRGQGQTALFFSSHSFGFLSASQVEVNSPPCSGWNVPLFDVAQDPASSYARVVLGLEDGDVLVYSTQSGKNKVCDLALKFPHISTLPYSMHVMRGHVLALPTPLSTTLRADDHARELLFFNTAAMEAGYGTSQSRALTLQVSFAPRKPEQFTIFSASASSSGGGGSTGAGAGGGKVLMALRFTDRRGVELYELSLKAPPPPSASSGSGTSSGGGSTENDLSSWLDWIPKLGIFGVALIGVVFWNVRKVTSQKQKNAQTDFDDDFFRERLRKAAEAKAAEAAEKRGASLDLDSGVGGASSGGLDDRLDSLLAQGERAMASMDNDEDDE